MPRVTIQQHDITDCGAACLASIAAYYKLKLPISKIRQLAGTDKKGTSVLGLIEAAQKIGFEVKGVKADFESLSEIPKPAIAHVIVNGRLHHYVVIYEVTKTHVAVMNPAFGKMIKMTHEAFKKEWTGVLVIMLPDENFKKGNEKVSVLKRFWFLLKPHKFILFQAFVGSIVFTLLGFSTALYLEKITDHVLVGSDTKLLNTLSIVMLVLLVFNITISAYKDIFLTRTGQMIDARLILGYYKHLLKLPQQFFDTMRVGEIISRISDAVKIRYFINGVALELAVNVLIIVFSFGIMFTYYWKLALIMMGIIPIYILIYYIVDRLNSKAERRLMEKSADLESQLVESLNAVSTIKRFGLEDFANQKTEKSFISLLKTTYYSALNGVFASTSSSALTQLFTIILLWVGSYFVIHQEITIGELLSFYAIIGYFTVPIASLVQTNKEIQAAWIAADRLFEIMDLEIETSSDQKIKMTPEKVGDIKFNNVSFRYGTRVKVFENFDLTLKKSKISAIVGESGSGKSTLASLLQLMYPVNEGTISIGEYDLKDLENESLRKIVSVVPQKIDLFGGSVIENIAIGDSQPDADRIIKICEDIGIKDYIETLPEGFGTYLGEIGVMLSGGQKQRIAIARALYKNPEILILDEATSSLDSHAEHYIRKTVEKLRTSNKTIILIAHRLSTVVNADEIVVMKNGKVVEQASHQELYAQKGHYFKLWQQQLPKDLKVLGT